jgi:hypothetical protein
VLVSATEIFNFKAKKWHFTATDNPVQAEAQPLTRTV